MHTASGHQDQFFFGTKLAIHHPYQHYHADIIVEPGIDNQSLQWCIKSAFRRGNTCNDGFENIVNTHACFGRTRNGFGGVDADDIFNFLFCVFGIGLWQIHFVQYRHHVDTQLQCGVAIGNCLCFHALRCINDQQCAFAGRQGTTYFIGEVNVPGCVDQVQIVGFAVLGNIA